MDETHLYLGADGGGTKTVGVLARPDGRVLASARVGATNPNVVGVDETAEHLAELVVACCGEAGVDPGLIGGAVFGLAGAGNPAIQEPLLAALRTVSQKKGFVLPPIRIETDARIALEGAFAGGPGIIVIAGTGSAVLGKSPEGEIRLVGGWGRTLGDEGSGHFTGMEALRAVARMMDGREGSTSLRRKLETEFGLDSRQKVVQAVYQEGFAIPSLAPTVIAAAEEGDSRAIGILERGSALLAEQVGVLVKLYGSLPEIGVVFVGGLIDHEGLPARLLAAALRSSAPACRVRTPVESPALGAVRLARQVSSTQR